MHSKIKTSINEKTFGNLTYNPNTKFRNSYPQTHIPETFEPVKKKKRVKKQTNLVTTLFVFIITVFFAICVFPFALKTFFIPLITSNDIPFRVDYAKIYSPTSKYLYNELFLGTPLLKGAETNKPAMQQMEMTSRMFGLQAKLLELSQQYQTIHPSVFVWDYETGRYAGLNSAERFPAASIIKIPVLLQLFRSIETGQLSIQDKMILTDYYRAEGSGDLQFQRTGNEYSMDALARKMIQISDNSSTNMLMSSIGGMNDVNRAIKSWGLKDTEVNNWLPDLKGTNVTTAEDLARMLFNIENDKFLSQDSKSKILDYMGNVKNNRLIHAGLDSRAQFFHKTGDIGHMLGDAGIVVTPDGHKYIVCILARRPYNSPAGKEFTVRASSIIYETLSSRNF